MEYITCCCSNITDGYHCTGVHNYYHCKYCGISFHPDNANRKDHEEECTMNKIKANSSNLESFWYDKEKKMLTVEFKNGSVYEYLEVPEKVFNEMRVAESKGKFLNKYIKNVFKFKKEGV